MLDFQLRNFKSGVLFFYSGSADQIQHMFWREMESRDSQFGDTIEKVYEDMDYLVGYAASHVSPDTLVIALSDHGFADFSRAFSLNNWLEQENYAARRSEAGTGYLEPFDWAKTRAYGLGFTGLYVNLKGREKKGWFPPADRDRLLDEIQRKLLEIRDPINGKPVVTKVYRADRVYSGDQAAKGPDLIVGYNRGYRASWESVLGLFSPQVLCGQHRPVERGSSHGSRPRPRNPVHQPSGQSGEARPA